MDMIEIIKEHIFNKKSPELVSPKSRKGRPRSNSDVEMRSRQFNFKVTPSIYNRLIEASKRLGRSKSSIMISAITEYLDRI